MRIVRQRERRWRLRVRSERTSRMAPGELLQHPCWWDCVAESPDGQLGGEGGLSGRPEQLQHHSTDRRPTTSQPKDIRHDGASQGEGRQDADADSTPANRLLVLVRSTGRRGRLSRTGPTSKP